MKITNKFLKLNGNDAFHMDLHIMVQAIFHSPVALYPYLLRHNGHNGVSNHQPHHGLLNSLFTHRSKKTSKLRVHGLCEFHSQMASNAEIVSIWWHHHATTILLIIRSGHHMGCLFSVQNLTYVVFFVVAHYGILYCYQPCHGQQLYAHKLRSKFLKLHNPFTSLSILDDMNDMYLIGYGIQIMIYRELRMYSSDEVFQRLREGYFGV